MLYFYCGAGRARRGRCGCARQNRRDGIGPRELCLRRHHRVSPCGHMPQIRSGTVVAVRVTRGCGGHCAGMAAVLSGRLRIAGSSAVTRSLGALKSAQKNCEPHELHAGGGKKRSRPAEPMTVGTLRAVWRSGGHPVCSLVEGCAAAANRYNDRGQCVTLSGVRRRARVRARRRFGR